MVDRTQAAIANAMLQGRGPDSVDRHNPDWRYYKMYPEIYDGIEAGDADGYNLQEESPRQHMFGTYAQYYGQPQQPEIPTARDIRRFEGSNDPEMKRRFEDTFGIQRRERVEQGIGPKDDYTPMPRPRPREAPLGPGEDEYSGDESGMMGPYDTTRPNPDEVYSYMPGLRDRVMEHLHGPGPASQTKGDREDGSMFDRAMEPFQGQDTGNIQDLRTMAIDALIKRGGGNVQPEPQSMDDIIQRQLEEWRAGNGQER